MTTKQKIIKKIEAIHNKELLENLQQLITALEDTYSAETFSKEEIAAVQEGYAQYKNDDTISQEEAQKQFEKWLKEK